MAIIESRNPFNNQLLTSFDELSTKALFQKIELSAQTFKAYKKTSFEFRKNGLLNIAKILRKNKEEYAKIMSLEMGKRKVEALSEIEKCALTCEYYVAHGESFLQDTIIESDAQKSLVAYQPLGTVLAVMPWNFPFWQVFRFAIPALLAGNVGLLKHASNVPQCALAIEEIIEEAGFPKGAFQTLMISSSKVQQVIENSHVKGVTLTGSEYAGSKVAEMAGKMIKKSVLELGGSDPFIVLEDADIDQAVEIGIVSRYMNCGQTCIAAKRFLVDKVIEKEFVEKFKKKVSEFVTGNPLKETTTLAPMARMDLVNDLEKQVDTSVEQGAEVLVGGKRIKGDGAFFEATVLSNIQKGMPAYDEELFGPVAVIIPYSTEEEAIQLANDTPYGLGASIWTKNIEKGEQLAREIEAGCVHVNELVKSDPRLPFGGVKLSGYGRELSLVGIREFVNQKTIYIK